jgi:hypothetical protein
MRSRTAFSILAGNRRGFTLIKLAKLRLKPTRRLLRMASPLTLKNPGPDLALTEIFCLVKLPHSRETIDGLVLSRQGGLDINVKIFAYEDG